LKGISKNNGSSTLTIIDTFNQRIEDFLKNKLKNHIPENRKGKVIHDPLWGSTYFHPWEIAIIDTPLFQRLRKIHQTGTAFYTYPSSIHDRFTHSLGVVILADKLIKRLREDLIARNYRIDLIIDRDIYEVRLAGLLHDLGHCFFSHTSEQILEKISYVKELKDKHPVLSQNKKKIHLHEIFAFLILNSPPFLEIWETIKTMFPNKDVIPNMENVAKIIIGVDIEPKKRFLREIITGPYDVDKLEYLYRDAYHAGLNIAYDVERFFYRIRIADTSEYSKKPEEMRLVMDIKGVPTVEQLIFSKMMLFSYIYHHQKVRATDSLLRDIVMELLEGDGTDPFNINHVCDLLNYTDIDLLSIFAESGGDTYNKMIRNLQNRHLLKRCLVICKDYLEGEKADQTISENYEILCEDMRDILIRQIEMRTEILDRINGDSEIKYTIQDILIDLPKIPPIEEAAKAPIIMPDDQIDSISSYFQLKGWQEVYELKKLRGYFYVPSELVTKANSIIKEYITEKYGLSFKPLASQLAKVEE